MKMPPAKVAIALNSASQLEHEITSCFLLRHEISESPRNRQKSVVEWRVYGQLAQLTSE